MRQLFPVSAIALLFTAAAFVPARTQAPPASPFDALHFRDIGPAATSGRLHDVQIDPKDPATLYVAAASGGLWKSVNKGVTWKPMFEKQPDNTFGALAIFARDPRIVWAGTPGARRRRATRPHDCRPSRPGWVRPLAVAADAAVVAGAALPAPRRCVSG